MFFEKYQQFTFTSISLVEWGGFCLEYLSSTVIEESYVFKDIYHTY